MSLFKKVKSGFDKATHAVKDVVEDTGDAFKDVGKTLSKETQDAVNKASKTFKDLSDKTESAFKSLGDDILEELTKMGNPLEAVVKEVTSGLKDLKSKLVGEISGMGQDIRNGFREFEGGVMEKFDAAGKEIEGGLKTAGDTIKKDVIDEIEEGGKKAIDEIEKFAKKAFNAGVPDILLKTATPDSISISGQLVGNGISISYDDSNEAIDEVMEMIRKGKFNVDIMYHVIPDSITISVGVELALIISVDVGADISFSSQEDIKMIVDWFKANT